MALQWAHNAGGRRYEIRTAGRSVRLYTNGVLHSQYHPGHVFCGGVWDLLALPALWNTTGHFPGILLLGLGGGAVVRQLHELVGWDRFVALERNPVHADIARRFFGLGRLPVEILEMDARRWMDSQAGVKFDLLIDDLFSDRHRDAQRSISFSRDWYGRLRRLLSDRGTLVVNFSGGRELKRSLRQIPTVKRDFTRAYRLTLPAYGNAIAVLLREHGMPETLEEALNRITPRKRTSRLRYHLEPLKL